MKNKSRKKKVFLFFLIFIFFCLLAFYLKNQMYKSICENSKVDGFNTNYDNHFLYGKCYNNDSPSV